MQRKLDYTIENEGCDAMSKDRVIKFYALQDNSERLLAERTQLFQKEAKRRRFLRRLKVALIEVGGLLSLALLIVLCIQDKKESSNRGVSN